MKSIALLVETLSERGITFAKIVALSAFAADVSITGLEIITDQLEEGRGPILDSWDLLKLVAIAMLLLVAARRANSRGLAVFAGVFLSIGITDQFFALDQIAEWVVDTIDFGGLGAAVPGESAAWVELLILLLLASAALGLLLRIRDSWDGYRRVRKAMLGLLVILAFFAIGVDLVAASSPFTELATLVEETGERVTLSATLAYVTGLGVTIRNQDHRSSHGQESGKESE